MTTILNYVHMYVKVVHLYLGYLLLLKTTSDSKKMIHQGAVWIRMCRTHPQMRQKHYSRSQRNVLVVHDLTSLFENFIGLDLWVFKSSVSLH